MVNMMAIEQFDELETRHSFLTTQRKDLVEPGPVIEGGPDVSPRWVGSGWTIFDNKGRPVRKYEPFFSTTSAFEFAAQLGVSSVLFYDPPGRRAPAVPLGHKAAQANRLAYLDESDPYYVGRTFPKLTTPMWVGDKGVEAVVILAIDDMREPDRYEKFLRPILRRLERIDGRAPVSIMTNRVDPRDARGGRRQLRDPG